MSWWDSAGFSNLAQNALKSAQKKIDKVLDIQADGDDSPTHTPAKATKSWGWFAAGASAPDSPVKEVSTEKQKPSEQDNFWNTWFESGDSPSTKSPQTTTPTKAKLSGSPTLDSATGKRPSAVRSKPRALFSGSRSSTSATSTLRSDSEASASESEQNVLRTSGSTSSIVSESGSSSDSQASVIKSPSTEELEPLSPSSTVPKKSAPLKLGSRTTAKRKESDLKKEGSAVDVNAKKIGDDSRKPAQVSGVDVADVPPPDAVGSGVDHSTSSTLLESPRVTAASPVSGDLPQVTAASPISVSEDLPQVAAVSPVSIDKKLPDTDRGSSQASPASDHPVIDAASHSPTLPESTLSVEHLQSSSDPTPETSTHKQVSDDSERENIVVSPVSEESVEVIQDTSEVNIVTEQDSATESKDESDAGREQQDATEHQEEERDGVASSFSMRAAMDDSSAWSDSRLPEMEDSTTWGDSQLPEIDDSITLPHSESNDTEAALCDEPKVIEPSIVSESNDEDKNTSIEADAGIISASDLPEVHDSPAACGDTSLPEIPEVEEDSSLTPQQEVVPSFPPAGDDIPESDVKPPPGECISDELSESNRTLTSEDFTEATKDNSADVKDTTVADVEDETIAPESVKSAVSDESSSLDAAQHPGAAPAESSDAMTVSSSSSIIVKTMLEDAMTESMKDNDTHSCGSSDKSSEMVRIESGLNSGHTSGDEIDTTTSSDIEIISTPTPNGSDRDRIERPFDLSPLRHALSRTVRRGSPPGHKRSDSSSSGQSTWSKNGDDLIGSPDGTLHVHGEQEMSSEGGHLCQASHPGHQHHPRQQRACESEQHGGSNPLETEKLLKDSGEMVASTHETGATAANLDTISESVEASASATMAVVPGAAATGAATELTHDSVMIGELEPTQAGELIEKLAEMAEVLEAREKKLLDLSRENIDLHEGNTILRNQLHQSEEAHEAEMTDLNAITEEFAVRISESEKKLLTAARERDHLKKQLQETEGMLARKSDNSNATEKLLQEKDQQISELLEEGEKLSKQQLQANNIIKKLRAKEKETDGTIKSQIQKLETQKKELEHLKKVLDSKEDLEKRQVEAIGQLNSAVKKQESEIARLKAENEDGVEKIRSLETALDKSYKELGDLHKANASKQSEAMEQALSAELQAKEELRMMYDREQQRFHQEHEALLNQIEDLRISLSRQEKEHGRREDVLRQEIADLQQRLQEAEDRNQDLTQSVTAATRPLLRQIENLQSTYGAQSASYEKVEVNLTGRLAEAQTQLAAAVEKERAASEKVMEISARLTTLESQVTLLRQEKSRLSAELEMERTKLEILEDAKNNETAQLTTLKQKYEKELADMKREKVLLEGQIEMERMKTETERKKFALAQDQLNEKDYLLQSQQQKRLSSTPSPRSTPRPISRGSSIDPLSESFTQEEILEKTLMMASSNGSKPTLYDALRTTGAATLVENLQSQLKMREGEITQLQSEIHELERTREAMARELVNLTTQNDELKHQVEEYPELKERYKDMDNRYQALLQMYGEKVEETDELRLDLQDVKDMYKGQIEMLLKNR